MSRQTSHFIKWKQPGDTSPPPLQLNGLDWHESRFSIDVAYLYPKALDPAVLVESLRILLRSYPHLTGRWRWQKGIGPVVDCVDEGVLFEVYTSRETLVDWQQPDQNNIQKHVPTIYPQAWWWKPSPLCKIRLTQLNGGGSILGVSMAHLFADAAAFFTWMSDWSDVLHGVSIPSLHWNREMFDSLKQTHSSVPAPLEDAPTCEGFVQMTLSRSLRFGWDFFRYRPQVRGRIFRIPTKALHLLKQQAQEDVAFGSRDVARTFSTQDVLCTLLFREINRLFSSHTTQELATLAIVADMRKRLTPPIPPRFFGNAVSFVMLEWTTQQWLETSLAEAAMALRTQIQRLSLFTFAEQLQWLNRRMLRRQMMYVAGDHRFFEKDLFVSSFTPFPIYDADLGAGSPFAVVLPTPPVPRVVRILPSPIRQSYDLHISLTEPMFQRLQESPWSDWGTWSPEFGCR